MANNDAQECQNEVCSESIGTIICLNFITNNYQQVYYVLYTLGLVLKMTFDFSFFFFFLSFIDFLTIFLLNSSRATIRYYTILFMWRSIRRNRRFLIDSCSFFFLKIFIKFHSHLNLTAAAEKNRISATHVWHLVWKKGPP